MATSISTKPIPRTGELLPVIGLGTWQTFDVGRSESGRAPLREVLRDFARLGGKVIDSSPMYDQSESVVGDVAAELKLHNQLFIATKSIVSQDQQVLTIHFNPCQRSSIRQQSKLI